MNSLKLVPPIRHVAGLALNAILGKTALFPLLHGILKGFAVDGCRLRELMAGGTELGLFKCPCGIEATMYRASHLTDPARVTWWRSVAPPMTDMTGGTANTSVTQG